MGKNRKQHRQKVKARNERLKAEQRKQQQVVKDFLNQLGLTPEEALAKVQSGELKPDDAQVFGPKETVTPAPLATLRLPE